MSGGNMLGNHDDDDYDDDHHHHHHLHRCNHHDDKPKQGLDMSLCDYDGRTALHLAAAEGQLPCVEVKTII